MPHSSPLLLGDSPDKRSNYLPTTMASIAADGMSNSTQIRQKFGLLTTMFNERQRRLWAAAEALALGRGGITRVAGATGLSPKTIRAGLRELRGLEAGVPGLLDPAK